MLVSRRAVVMSAIATPGLQSQVFAQNAWDMPTPYTDGTFHTQNIRWMVEEIAKATNNQLRIQVHSSASLIRHQEILRAVSTGQVAIGEILISQFGNEDAIYELDALPFLTNGPQQARALYDASKSALEAAFSRRGVRLLNSIIWPSQGFYTKGALASGADMVGMRFRTTSPVTSRMAELLGAVPTTVQASELAQAFATNIVSGMITSGATGVQSRAWEYCSFFTNLRANNPKNAVIVNERAFQRLPESARTAVLRIASEAEARGWARCLEVESETLETLRRNGMTIAEPSSQLLSDVRAVGSRLTDEWLTKAGDVGRAILADFRARV